MRCSSQPRGHCEPTWRAPSAHRGDTSARLLGRSIAGGTIAAAATGGELGRRATTTLAERSWNRQTTEKAARWPSRRTSHVGVASSRGEIGRCEANWLAACTSNKKTDIVDKSDRNDRGNGIPMYHAVILLLHLVSPCLHAFQVRTGRGGAKKGRPHSPPARAKSSQVRGRAREESRRLLDRLARSGALSATVGPADVLLRLARPNQTAA